MTQQHRVISKTLIKCLIITPCPAWNFNFRSTFFCSETFGLCPLFCIWWESYLKYNSQTHHTHTNTHTHTQHTAYTSAKDKLFVLLLLFFFAPNETFPINHLYLSRTGLSIKASLPQATFSSCQNIVDINGSNVV